MSELEAGPHDPFYEDHAQPHRWLVTTSIAGVAGSLVITGALLGFFGEPNTTGAAQASVAPVELWQRPSVTSKSDLNGQVANALQAQPYRTVSVVYNPNSRSSTFTTTTTGNKGSLLGSYDPSEPVVLDGNVHTDSPASKNITTIIKQLPPEPVDKTFVLKSGETLIERLVELGIAAEVAAELAAALEPVFPGKLLKAGQKFEVTLDQQQSFYGNDILFPVELTFSPGANEEITVKADEDGKFYASVNGKKQAPSRYAAPRSGQFRVTGRVTSSLYASAKDQGIPEYIINQVIRAFSYDVDFQRDITTGTKYEIYFGNPLSGSSTRRKVVHYASLTINGKKKELFRFTDSRGKTAYYDSRGRGATKTLMRTPISGARISSGFGMRRHPVLGYSKMHAGIDFAAPRGTPIRSAGSGVVVTRGWKGGYGRVVEVKHSNGYMTRYAHMKGFASGLRRGQPVRQGQVIGYVGASGRATGPHLHYEIRIKGRAVNPSRVRIAGVNKLKGRNLAKFKKHRLKIASLMKKVPVVTRVASLNN